MISFTGNTAGAKGSEVAQDLYIGQLNAGAKPVVDVTGLGRVQFAGGIAGVASAVMNSSVKQLSIANAADYLGQFNQKDGRTTLTGTFFGGKVSVTGGALDLTQATGVGKGAGTVTLAGGSLSALIGQVYVKGSTFDEINAMTDTTLDLKNYLTATSGTLALADEGEYTQAALALLGSGLKQGMKLEITKATLKTDPDKPIVDLVADVIQSTQDVTVAATNGLLEGRNAGGKTLTVSDGFDPEGNLHLQGNLTLVGSVQGGAILTKANGLLLGSLALENDSTLNVGSVNMAKTQTQLPDQMVVNGGATLSLVNTTALGAQLTMANDSRLNVGNTDAAAQVQFDQMNLAGGHIVIDPAFTGQGIDGASLISSAALVDKTIGARVDVDRNAVFAVGATAGQVKSHFARLAAGNQLTWADDSIASIAYFGHPTRITGTVNVGTLQDGSANVSVASGGLLIVDQAQVPAQGGYLGASVAFEQGGYLGVVNAREGEFLLQEPSISRGVYRDPAVITDNYFVKGSYAQGAVSMVVQSAELGSAIASTGLQQMTRRADQMLATAVADRTSLDQAMEPGLNLWVDVAGERYEADSLDQGGQFTSDMAYATVGGDVEVGSSLRLGGAVQYAQGKVRSNNLGLRNAVDSIGLTAYGAWRTSDNSMVVADAAYVMGSNDLTSSVENQLNQSVDTQMASVGVRAQYQATLGEFAFVPSIGLRVSSLKTDAVKVGAVRVEDQSQTVVQMPIALRINAAQVSAQGWTIAPSLKIAYVPTFGDEDIRVGAVHQTVLDTSPVQADFGVRAQKGNFLLNANVMLGGGQDGASNIGGKVGLKYVF